MNLFIFCFVLFAHKSYALFSRFGLVYYFTNSVKYYSELRIVFLFQFIQAA